MKRFTLYGSPHSLPTYKVALMLRMSGEAFSFRYVSFQKGMHKTPEFRALSRWGQVPVLVDGARAHCQSGAIVEHLADVLGRFQGPDAESRQAVREWLYWDADTLYPPIYGCYSVLLDRGKLLPSSRPSPTTTAAAPTRLCRGSTLTWSPRPISISAHRSPPWPTCFAAPTSHSRRCARST